MTVARDMLAANPVEPSFDTDDLAALLDAAFECAQACTACAESYRGCEQACGHLLAA